MDMAIRSVQMTSEPKKHPTIFKKRNAQDAILQKIICTELRVKISENATIGRFLGLVYLLPSSI